MGTPTLYEIAEELNARAHAHPIGKLQELRGHRPGNDLFRVNSKTTQDRWACHWGGRTELQFNIGIEESKNLRYGVAFSFEESREYKSDELIATLAPKVRLFNTFIRRHPRISADMSLWAWDDGKGETVYHPRSVKTIPRHLVAKHVFVFLGKYQPINRVDYELILDEFDRLLPLYQYVESRGKRKPISVQLETNFLFRAGCRTKKRTAIVSQRREQIERDLRHNELQKVLYRRLVNEFGKESVGTEIQGKNGTSIDVVVRRRRAYWFYEIKTAESPRACIREAMGQLLEYAFWPGAQGAVRLIIAGECALDKDGKDYLRYLNKRFALPLEYEQIRV